jgi:hypothetical protein
MRSSEPRELDHSGVDVMTAVGDAAVTIRPERLRVRWDGNVTVYPLRGGVRMTGPEHYVAAEEILFRLSVDDAGSPVTLAALARAQVHATLANGAATALGERYFREWLDVAGPPLAAD